MTDKTEQVPLGTLATIETILGAFNPHMIGFIVAWMDHHDMINGEEDREIQRELVKLAGAMKSLATLFPDVVRKDKVAEQCPAKVIFVPVLQRILAMLEVMAQYYATPAAERDETGFKPEMFREMGVALEREMERYD